MLRRVLSLGVITAYLLVGRSAGQGDVWAPVAGLPGTNGVVQATLVRAGPAGPELIVGGSFTMAGTTAAFNVARWDGRAWHSVGARAWTGGGSANQGAVYALAEYRGELYAAGIFASADGQAAANIARFDGVRWHPLNSGLDQGAYALAVFQDELVVAGGFRMAGTLRVSQVARWNGREWLAFPATFSANSSVRSLLVDSGRLVFGGVLSARTVVDMLAWDGVRLTPLGAWPGSIVNTLARVGPEIWAGTLSVGGVGANVNRWDGAQWIPCGIAGPSSGAPVQVLALREWGGQVIAGGTYSTPGGDAGGFFSRWNGQAWETIGDGYPRFSGVQFTRVAALESLGDRLIVAGSFTRLGAFSGNYLFAYAGNRSETLGEGFNDGVGVLLPTAGALYVGGGFSTVPGINANAVASFDGRAWSTLGTGFTSRLGGGSVRSLAVFRGRLVAAGSFELADGRPASSIAEWNGRNWLPLGAGIPEHYVANEMCVHNDRLVVHDSTGQIRAWDGLAWTGMGGGPGESDSFLVHNDVLYRCRTSSSGVGELLRWDGAAWRPFGRALQGGFSSLGVLDNRIMMGGYFSLAGEWPAGGVVVWNGGDWSRLGQRLMTIPEALVFHRGELFAAGSRGGLEGEPTGGVVRWDGERWIDTGGVGSGAGSFPEGASDAAVFQGDLYVAGSFLRAGRVLSPYLARLTRAACAADMDDGTGRGLGDGGVTIDDLLYYLDVYAAGGRRADLDDGSGSGHPDGGVSADDFLYYLGRYAAGC